MLGWIAKQQTLFYQVSEVNVSGRKGGLYFWAEIFNGRICSNVTVITVTRKFANYCNYSNVDLSAVSTGVYNVVVQSSTIQYHNVVVQSCIIPYQILTRAASQK